MKRIVIVSVIAVALSSYFLFDLQRYLRVEFFPGLYSQRPITSVGVCVASHILATAFSLLTGPGRWEINDSVSELRWQWNGGLCPREEEETESQRSAERPEINDADAVEL